jgi:hypothetical protein
MESYYPVECSKSNSQNVLARCSHFYGMVDASYLIDVLGSSYQADLLCLEDDDTSSNQLLSIIGSDTPSDSTLNFCDRDWSYDQDNVISHTEITIRQEIERLRVPLLEMVDGKRVFEKSIFDTNTPLIKLLQWFLERTHLLKNLNKTGVIYSTLHKEIFQTKNAKKKTIHQIQQVKEQIDKLNERIEHLETKLDELEVKERSSLEQKELLQTYGRNEQCPKTAVMTALFVELWGMEQDEIVDFRNDAPEQLHDLIDAYCKTFRIGQPPPGEMSFSVVGK